MCSLYEVKAGDTWTLISHNLFGTIRLWWLLCKFNNITDPFERFNARYLYQSSK